MYFLCYFLIVCFLVKFFSSRLLLEEALLHKHKRYLDQKRVMSDMNKSDIVRKIASATSERMVFNSDGKHSVKSCASYIEARPLSPPTSKIRMEIQLLMHFNEHSNKINRFFK